MYQSGRKGKLTEQYDSMLLLFSLMYCTLWSLFLKSELHKIIKSGHISTQKQGDRNYILRELYLVEAYFWDVYFHDYFMTTHFFL